MEGAAALGERTIRGFIFIAIYISWLLLLKSVNSQKDPLGFRTVLATSMLQSVGFTLFPSIHAGVLNLKLGTAFAAFGLIAPIILVAIKPFLSRPSESITGCGIWLGLKTPASVKYLMLPAAIALALYPLVVLYTIISPPHDPVRFAIQSIVALLMFAVTPLLVWIFWGMIADKFWTDQIRFTIAASMFSGIANTILLVSLGLWAFDLAGTSKSITVAGTIIQYSPAAMGVSAGFALFVYLAPYLRGSILSRRVTHSQHEARISTLNRLIIQLQSPATDAKAILADLKQQVDKDMDAYWDTCPVLGLAARFEEDESQPAHMREAVSISKHNHLKFLNWNWFLQLTIELEKAEESLEMTDVQARAAQIERWASFFSEVRSQLEREFESYKNRKPSLLVIGTVVTTFVLTKIADMFWDYLERTAIK